MVIQLEFFQCQIAGTTQKYSGSTRKSVVFCQSPNSTSQNHSQNVCAKPNFHVSVNRDFSGVVDGCADREDTWINAEIRGLYLALHSDGSRPFPRGLGQRRISRWRLWCLVGRCILWGEYVLTSNKRVQDGTCLLN